VETYSDVNEVDPQDGYDVISTIDVYIQDIVMPLLKQLHYS
jgi:cell division protein FtsI (penicillin-binding protein 3)